LGERQPKEKPDMVEKIITCILYPVLVIGITAGLLSVAYAATDGNIDPQDKWAWSTNAGWINFDPPNGGVTVYADHLEGYAWGENVGWIRLGTHTGGDAHTYGNTSATDYGVNRDASNNLYGYGWGTNVGWINFDPDGAEGVTIDPVSGDFSGYAWGENVGWIHFNSSGPVAYKVSMLVYRIYLSLVMRGS
jgi:hypothetical protein